jgi:hypothetical protein
MIMEEGKFYRLKNGQKLEILKQHEVDSFEARITTKIGDMNKVITGCAFYKRDGKYSGAEDQPDFEYHAECPWYEAGVSSSKDMDGWGLEKFREAINKSGLFPW